MAAKHGERGVLVMRIVQAAAWIAALWSLTTIAQAQGTASLAITHVNVVDVVDGHIDSDRTVIIQDGNIERVDGGSPPANARIVDAKGKYLIPGLWDMHAHTGGPTPTPALERFQAKWLELYVLNGVTGIRDMGSELEIILKLRAGTASGAILGPRIFTAGPILDDAPGDWPLRLRVKTAADGRAAVQMLKAKGVDLIKVHDHTPREAFFAIADEARRQHLPLAGHRPLAVKMQEVLDAGQGDIEHLDNNRLWFPCSGGKEYHPDSCKDFFAMLARRQIWQTPTLVAFAEVATLGTQDSQLSEEELAYASKPIRNGWALNQSTFITPANRAQVVQDSRTGARTAAIVTRDLANAGVPILTGCDFMIAGFCVHDELHALVSGGMTPLAALQSATLAPARYLKVDETLGSIAPGKRADLVLLDANPLQDIANTRRIRAVLLGGRFLDRSEIDRRLAQVRSAAKATEHD